MIEFDSDGPVVARLREKDLLIHFAGTMTDNWITHVQIGNLDGPTILTLRADGDKIVCRNEPRQ